jgi:hypothetical protein
LQEFIMDMSSVSGIASLATNANSAQTSDALGVRVLNKALDAQVQTAAALIESVAQSAPPAALPGEPGAILNEMA